MYICVCFIRNVSNIQQPYPSMQWGGGVCLWVKGMYTPPGHTPLDTHTPRQTPPGQTPPFPVEVTIEPGGTHPCSRLPLSISISEFQVSI